MPIVFGEEGIGAPPEDFGEAVGDPIGHALGVVMDAEIDERCSHENFSVPAAGVTDAVAGWGIGWLLERGNLDDVPTATPLGDLTEVPRASFPSRFLPRKIGRALG